MLEVVRTTVIAPSLANRSRAAAMAATIHSVTAKTPPVNADEIAITDSAASYALKKVTFANFKAAALASAALTGTPTAPTPLTGDNDTSVATTAFVKAAMAVGGVNPGSDVSAAVSAATGFSVLRTMAARAADAPFIEDVGSPVAGDWTDVFQTAAAEGIVFQLRRDTTYTLTSQITCSVNGFGLIGPRSAIIYLPAASWTSLHCDPLAANTVFLVSGSLSDTNSPRKNLLFSGFTIESEVQESRSIHAFYGRNLQNIIIENIECFGFPVGFFIRLSTVRGGWFCGNYIHDFLQDAVATFLYAGDVVFAPQSTAIAIDGERVSNTNSNDIIIIGNVIANIEFTGAAATTWQYQTDGINHQGAQQSSRCIIGFNSISGVGEGIDNFASNVSMPGNVIGDCKEFGIKLIHAASKCSISGGTIRRCGRTGIIVTSTTAGGCIGNAISGVTIEDINPENRTFSPDIQTACIIIGGADPNPAYDTAITGCVLDPGTFGEYVVNDLGVRTRYSSNNVEIKAGTAGRYYTFYSRSLVPAGGRPAFQASNAGAGQSGITGGVATDVAYGNTTSGQGVYNWGDCFASSIWTPPAGHFRGGASVRITGTFASGALAGIVILRDSGAGYATMRARQVPCPIGSSLTFTIALDFEDISTGAYSYKVQAYAAVSTGTVSFPADNALTNFWARMT